MSRINRTRITGAFLRVFAVAMIVFITLCGAASAIDINGIKLNGYLDLEYKQTSTPEGTAGTEASKSTNGAFDMRHFNLLMEAAPLPELMVKAHVEFDHGTNTEIGSGSIILEYGFGEYIIRDWLKIRGGKVLTPYGLYNEIHDATPAFLPVRIPETFYNADTRGGFALIPQWVTGMNVLGEGALPGSHHDLDYVLYVGNGESLASTNDSQYDDNPNKAVGGRFQFTDHGERFQVGVSGYYGDKATKTDKLSENHWTTTGSLNVNQWNLNLKGEYGYSRLGAKTETSWYVQSSYAIGRFTPYVLYMTLDPDTEVADDTWNTYRIGLNTKINDYLVFKLEWSDNHLGGHNNDAVYKGVEDFMDYRASFTLFF